MEIGKLIRGRRSSALHGPEYDTYLHSIQDPSELDELNELKIDIDKMNDKWSNLITELPVMKLINIFISPQSW